MSQEQSGANGSFTGNEVAAVVVACGGFVGVYERRQDTGVVFKQLQRYLLPSSTPAHPDPRQRAKAADVAGQYQLQLKLVPLALLYSHCLDMSSIAAIL